MKHTDLISVNLRFLEGEKEEEKRVLRGSVIAEI